MKSLRTYLTGSIVIALATLLQSGVIADDANWTGGGDGSTYSQIANWDTLDVPINNGTTYDVMIGGTPSVLFDAGVGSNTVDSLSLAQGATFTVNPGLTLNVLGVSNVGGRINVNNSTFSAPSATSMFSGRPYLFADNGGNINIAAASWAATYSDSQTIMRADNATISLATLGSLTANDNTSYTDTLTVHAANNGMIDLSKMVSTSSNDILRFLIESGGNILFTNLTTTNKVQFDIHVPALALPALNTANSTQFIARSGNAITANAMTDQAGGSVTLETNATFNATALQQMRNTTLSAENGATFNAPALTDVAGSTLNLDPGFTFTSGVLNNIDNSRFFVSGGLAFLDVSATAMTGTYSDSQTVIRAEGAGSSINLSSLTSLSLNDNTSYTDTLTVHARDNGVVNLAGLTSASCNDVLQFLIESGGDIPLPNLNTTSNVRFDVDVPTYSLPALAQASGTTFDIGSGSTLTANALTGHLGGSTNLQTNATFNATALQQMRNATLSAENGATFNAPALTDVAGSTLNLDPGFTFTSGVLNNIDNSRFFVSGGLAFLDVSATAMTGTYSDSQTVIRAEGAGSSINLSSLTSLSLNDNTSYTDTLTVRAGAGGKVDLSGVDTVSTNDKILFHVQSQSEIDLSSLQAVGGGQYEFRVEAEGTLKLGDFTVTNNSAFNINDATSVVNIGGSLLLDNPSTFNVATGGGVSVAGNFSFATTSETAFQSDDGILTMNGSGTFASPQWLEVGGQDLGLPTSPLDVLGDDGNFAIGQLVVGQDGQFTVVQLADAIDNGNRSSFEALYLPGLGGDGLEIFGGSVLNIESINVYAFLDGNWTHLNSLFTGGITEIELSSLVSDPEANGTIIVPEPATPALLALGLITAGLFGRRWKQQSPRSRQAEPRLHGL